MKTKMKEVNLKIKLYVNEKHDIKQIKKDLKETAQLGLFNWDKVEVEMKNDITEICKHKCKYCGTDYRRERDRDKCEEECLREQREEDE